MKKYRLKIAYQGTNYSGWQIQKNGLSIQALLQTALQTALRIPSLSLVGAGRTDAGVHAYEQVAHFTYPEELNLYKLKGSLNGLLPHDIRVLDLEKVALSFHAQLSAKRKIYHYHIYLKEIMNPFKYHTTWHIRSHLDKNLLKQASLLFIGEHDFESFTNLNSNEEKNFVRTIYDLRVVEEEEGIRLEFIGNGFLYKMVRNIVGCLVAVAKKQQPLEWIESLFKAKDRKKAPPPAPSQGLFLVKVLYEEDLQKNETS